MDAKYSYGSTPVVEGTPVGYGATPVATGEWTRGEKQESKCRDPVFAILFYINVAIIIGVAIALGPNAVSQTVQNVNSSTATTTTTTTTTASSDVGAIVYSVLATGFVAIGLSASMLWVMMRIPTMLIKISLWFVTILSGIWFLLALLSGSVFGVVFGLVFFAVSLCYARAVWSRIPFASANLLTATTAVKSNCGVTVQAYLFVVLAFVWSMVWIVAVVGVFYATSTCTTSATTGQTTCSSNSGWVFILLLFSYYFVHQVLHNTVHVIVSGVVGTWWFAPMEANSCCSRAIGDSTIRALTTSFGSICFGSLIVAIIQTLRELASQAQNQRDGNILACLAQCILSCIESLVEFFNRWAYVYVGLYGYSYLEAGKNVITLFRNRGWEAIIADNLVGNALFLLSLAVGLLSGTAGIIITASSSLLSGSGVAVQGAAFGLGFLVGIVMCSIVMSTVASAVNATIVLFAEAPAEFQENHPDLSDNMRAAWVAAWPGCL